MIAASAMRHSKKIEMYSEMSTKKTISASIALFVTDEPQLGPTALAFTAVRHVGERRRPSGSPAATRSAAAAELGLHLQGPCAAVIRAR